MMTAVMMDVEEQDLDSLPARTAVAAMKQECVLLIEDSEEAMLLVRFALEEYGRGAYRLEWANSLSKGLDHLAQGTVDMVLLDLGLPDSSGPESYAWVREIAPSTPVVVLTGDSRSETEFAVTASGVEGYLLKNQVSGAALIETMRAALYANKKKMRQLEERAGNVLPMGYRIG